MKTSRGPSSSSVIYAGDNQLTMLAGRKEAGHALALILRSADIVLKVP